MSPAAERTVEVLERSTWQPSSWNRLAPGAIFRTREPDGRLSDSGYRDPESRILYSAVRDWEVVEVTPDGVIAKPHDADEARSIINSAGDENLIAKRWINTRSGTKYYPLAPRALDVRLSDIIFALANECRYGGHVQFYSVAQHSTIVSHIVEQRVLREAAAAGLDVTPAREYQPARPATGETPTASGLLLPGQPAQPEITAHPGGEGWHRARLAARCALVHDAPEAYLKDLPRPLKHSPDFAAYREIERVNMAAICEALKLPPEDEWDPCIGEIDRAITGPESVILFPNRHPDWIAGLLSPDDQREFDKWLRPNDKIGGPVMPPTAFGFMRLRALDLFGPDCFKEIPGGFG